MIWFIIIGGIVIGIIKALIEAGDRIEEQKRREPQRCLEERRRREQKRLFLQGVESFITCLRLEEEYKILEREVFNTLAFNDWNCIPQFDSYVTVKSRQALENYDDIKFFKENKEILEKAEKIIKQKNDTATMLQTFLKNNEYQSRPHIIA